MKEKIQHHASSSPFYGLGFIGAAVFFISNAGGGFWLVLLGLLKAIFWPAFLIYYLLEYLTQT